MFLETDDERGYKVQLTDFGNTEEIQNNKQKSLKHLTFQSLNQHNGKPLQMKDDMESLMYIVVLLINSSLPWMNIEKKKGKSIKELMS